ncbi:MAG: tRNA (adenosine(37)-N6)-threonylcarbamoyltransferase complex ATPase subunit type 1 TsaE [Holosporales bacterium]|nr:tRNA (adenosine(37)-N6)-threonylcarbamoyltransferase complex ATPase subunit type 1 TsaE [Holosporales bacterium]
MGYKYSIDDLKSLAESSARSSCAPISYFLMGDIGTGKTTFSQFFIREVLINKEQEITSPTFNIVHIYDTLKGPVWHVDLYRIENPSEIDELGLLEAMNEAICLIEWPGLIMARGKRYNHQEIRFD